MIRTGNNTYYYTGNKEDGGGNESQEEDMDVSQSQEQGEGLMVGVYDENFEDSRDASELGSVSGKI